jgi:hypothetical protein
MGHTFNKIRRYFFELDFYYLEMHLGPDIQNKKAKWITIVYLLLSLGIFGRQITQFPKIDLNFSNITWPILATSFIVGFAILPFVMRRISKKNQGKPSIEHILGAFGLGFFMDFANQELMSLVYDKII